MEKWEFDPSLGEARLINLNNPPKFEAIVEQIKSEMKILCCHADLCNDQPGFFRPIYCIEVSRPLFDLFFNSRYGYRAFYCRSEYDGLKANKHFISTLLPNLIAFSIPLERNFTFESLNSNSAKAWLSEKTVARTVICDKCSGEWTIPLQRGEPQIYNNHWENNNEDLAICGRMAPFFTKILIFGGFINSKYDEFISSRKRNRSLEIHKYGWS